VTPGDSRDPLLRRLASLPSAVPPAASARRVRARCHAALARRSPHDTTRRPWTVGALVVNAAVIAALCIYLAQAAGEAFRLARLP
jgi:hypothetical protein